jgi:hypothetical protein
MMRGPTTADGYRALETFLDKFEDSPTFKLLKIEGVESSSIKGRLLQEIVIRISTGYIKHFQQNSFNRELGKSILNIDGLIFHIESLEISISFKLFFTSYLELLKVLLRNVATAFYSLFFRRKIYANVSLFLEAGGKHSYDNDSFFAYLKSGPLQDPIGDSFVIVKSGIDNFNTEKKFSYSKNPYWILIKYSLSLKLKLILLRNCLYQLFYAQVITLMNPVYCLLSRDLASLPLFEALNHGNILKNLFITNSFFSSQPLSFSGQISKNFSTHMVWYSQNFKPKTYVDDKSSMPLPSAKYIRADVHWVWTPSFADYLSKNISRKSIINAVGPIMWKLLPSVLNEKKMDEIVVFDITPLDSSKSFGATRNYYSFDRMKKFIIDVLSAKDEIQSKTGKFIRVKLKHKRGYVVNVHDINYIKFIESLINNKVIELIPHDDDIFELIQTSKLTISVPWTSTAVLSSHLKTAAIYYDPFNDILDESDNFPGLQFVSDYEKLKDIVYKAFI